MRHLILIGDGGLSVLTAAYIWGATQHWYQTIPGVAQTGPMNVHFAKDVGLAYLSSGVALIWAGAKHDKSAGICGASWLVLHAIFVGIRQSNVLYVIHVEILLGGEVGVVGAEDADAGADVVEARGHGRGAARRICRHCCDSQRRNLAWTCGSGLLSLKRKRRPGDAQKRRAPARDWRRVTG